MIDSDWSSTASTGGDEVRAKYFPVSACMIPISMLPSGVARELWGSTKIWQRLKNLAEQNAQFHKGQCAVRSAVVNHWTRRVRWQFRYSDNRTRCAGKRHHIVQVVLHNSFSNLSFFRYIRDRCCLCSLGVSRNGWQIVFYGAIWIMDLCPVTVQTTLRAPALKLKRMQVF